MFNDFVMAFCLQIACVLVITWIGICSYVYAIVRGGHQKDEPKD